MSATLSIEDVLFHQRMLCSAGCYGGPADGIWSSAVDDADVKLEAIYEDIADAQGRFDARTERNIRTLHPKAQEAARKFLSFVRAAGTDVRIISGTRTYAEQEALFRIGRFGDTAKVVTNAQAGASNHNFGVAWDIGIFNGGKYMTDIAPYKAVAVHCPAGVEWGGNWKTFPDPPHYQLATGLKLAEVRTRFEEGKPFTNV